MSLRLKTKIGLTTGVLFVMLAAVSALAMWSLHRLSQDAHDILKDNYISLQYVEQMREALDLFESDSIKRDSFLTVFDAALRLQETNITEPGEKEITLAVRLMFEEMRLGVNLNLVGLRRQLALVTEVNQQAILRKNNIANETADRTIWLLSIIATVLLMLVFTLLFNLPGYIADPVARLTEGIRRIAARNYGERLFFEGNDEFKEVADAFNEMATRLDAYEHSNLAQLQFEKGRVEAIVNNLNDAAIGLDETNRILFVNPVACNLLGKTEKEMVGQYAPDLALHNDLFRTLLQSEGETQPLKIFADGKESYFTLESGEVTVPRRNGVQRAGRVLLLKNITPFKELDLAKTNFIATISHELKTPISAIKMSLKLLADTRVGDLNAEQQKLTEQIGRDTDRLLHITSELLDITQIETGNIRLNTAPTPVDSLIDYAVKAVDMSLRDKNLQLHVAVEPGLPRLLVDPDKTAWVLINLLSNAVQHSPEGARIELQAFLEPDNRIRLSVRDFGKGIDPKYREKLFEKFFQAPANGGKTGSGLGLAIAREFIDAQGGHIWVESEPGLGAVFAFSLPTAPPSAE